MAKLPLPISLSLWKLPTRGAGSSGECLELALEAGSALVSFGGREAIMALVFRTRYA